MSCFKDEAKPLKLFEPLKPSQSDNQTGAEGNHLLTYGLVDLLTVAKRLFCDRTNRETETAVAVARVVGAFEVQALGAARVGRTKRT